MKPLPSTRSALHRRAGPRPSRSAALLPAAAEQQVRPGSSTSAATAGRKDTATAGAWRAGEARKACAVISRPDEDQDRRDRRLRQQRARAARRRPPRRRRRSRSAGGQRVAGARAHRLVRRMADVGRVLDHAAAAARPRSWPAPRSAGCRACGTRRPPRSPTRCCRCRRSRWRARRAPRAAGTAARRRGRRARRASATAGPGRARRAPSAGCGARRPDGGQRPAAPEDRASPPAPRRARRAAPRQPHAAHQRDEDDGQRDHADQRIGEDRAARAGRR